MSEDKTAGDAGKALQNIREAEDRAAAIVREARDDNAPRLIQAARDESAKIRDERLDKARGEAARATGETIDRARREAEEIRAGTELEKARIREQAAPLMDQAVQETGRKLAAILDGGSF